MTLDYLRVDATVLRVRSGRLKRDPLNSFHSRLHKRAYGRGYTLQYYRFGFANPVALGVERRRSPCTRERLCRLVLRASLIPHMETLQARNREWPFLEGSKAMYGQFTAIYVDAPSGGRSIHFNISPRSGLRRPRKFADGSYVQKHTETPRQAMLTQTFHTGFQRFSL
jgi:hypothetical protein